MTLKKGDPMRTVSKLLTVAVVGLALQACGKDGKETESPAAEQAKEAAITDPTKATQAAKDDFNAVVKKYESAKADGTVSKDECANLASQFHKVYKKHGKQMSVAFFNAGAVWEECGEDTKAEEVYLALVKAQPKYDLSYNNLGVLNWRRGEARAALRYFKKAVEVNPKTRAPRNNLAAALRNKYSKSPEQADFAAAEREIQRVLAVDSGNQMAYENLARLYYDRGRLKDKSYLLLADLVVVQAMRVFEKENIESADIYNLRGLLFMESSNLIDALKAFRKAAEIDPNHADAHMNIALISIRFRNYEEAEKSLKVAMKDPRQKKNVEAHIGLGVAQRGLRKYKAAEKSFKRAQKLRPKDPRPQYNLAILYQEHLATRDDVDLEGIKQHYRTAREYYSNFVSAAGSDKQLALLVADAKHRIENIDESFRTFKELKELEKKAKALEELARKQEEEIKKQLLQEEAAAIERAKAAEEAARKKADEEAKKKKADDKKADDKKADDKKDDKKKDDKKK
jgi:tetratricopeptide (TPR) repeat protein